MPFLNVSLFELFVFPLPWLGLSWAWADHAPEDEEDLALVCHSPPLPLEYCALPPALPEVPFPYPYVSDSEGEEDS